MRQFLLSLPSETNRNKKWYVLKKLGVTPQKMPANPHKQRVSAVTPIFKIRCNMAVFRVCSKNLKKFHGFL